MNYQQLLSRLGTGYTPLSEKEILARADAIARAEYEEKALAAKQSHAQKADALERELAALAPAYARERESRRAEDAAALSSLGENALKRGMQRSSYLTGSLALLLDRAAAAQADITRRQNEAEKSGTERRTLLASQLADTLAQYDRTRAGSAARAAEELRSREYERTRAERDREDQLALKLYEYAKKYGEGR